MLRTEILHTLDLVLDLELEPIDLVVWQAFWVGLFCRMLHTLSTGAVWSKPASMAWAQAALDPAWRGLIARPAEVKKGDEASSGRPADPAEVVATRAFAAFAGQHARQIARARDLLELA